MIMSISLFILYFVLVSVYNVQFTVHYELLYYCFVTMIRINKFLHPLMSIETHHAYKLLY